MSSINAKNVAKDVIKTVRKGEKVRLGRILLDNGYSKSVSLHPNKVTNTESYQEEIRPIVNQLETLRQNAISALAQTNLAFVEYKELVDGVDKFTKNIQLLSGKATGKIDIGDYKNLSDDELRKITSGKGVSIEGVSQKELT